MNGSQEYNILDGSQEYAEFKSQFKRLHSMLIPFIIFLNKIIEMENRLGWQGLGMGQVEENWYDYKGEAKGIHTVRI